MISIICPLLDFNSCYSVADIVKRQINLLVKKKHNINALFSEGFSSPCSCPVNTIPRHKAKEDIFLYASRVQPYFDFALSNSKLLIVHDVFFVSGFEYFNIALRIFLQRNSHIKVLSWSHSLGSETPIELLRLPIPNCTYVSINPYIVDLLAKQYRINPKDIVYVPNMSDPDSSILIDPIAIEIYNKAQLWNYDTIVTYPTRICQAKQVEKVVNLVCELNGIALILGAWANSDEAQEIIGKCQKIEKDYRGYSINYYSSLEEDYKLGLPKSTVDGLTRYSDLFIMPSIAESFSLITLDAALSKCSIVLNSDLEPLNLYSDLSNMFSNRSLNLSFGSISQSSNSDSIKTKSSLIKELQKDKSIQMFKYCRKEFDPNTVYDKYLSQVLNKLI